MLSQLPESRARRQRRSGGTLVSITVHALIVAALVRATAHATIAQPPREEAPPITFTEVTPTPAPTPAATSELVPNSSPLAPAANALAPELIAPAEIPFVLPAIDYSRAPTDPSDFASGQRRQLGGVVGGTGNAPSGGAFQEWQVERPVAVRPGNRGPDYPTVLREAGVEGLVVVQFVVDTLGRADLATVHVVRSDHAFFTSAVKRALEQMRFLPAEVAERKVPQWVMQPFQFRLDR